MAMAYCVYISDGGVMYDYVVDSAIEIMGKIRKSTILIMTFPDW